MLWLPHLESHQGPIAYRAIALEAELYGSVEALQPSHATPDRCFADWPRLRNRNAPSVAFSSREETGSAKWIRTTIKRINSALPCRVGHRGIIVAPPLLRSRPPRGHAMSLGRPGAHRLI